MTNLPQCESNQWHDMQNQGCIV